MNPKPLILSLGQFENGLPIIAELDLAKLFDVFLNLKADLPDLDLGGDAKAIMAQILQKPSTLKLFLPLLEMVGQTGKAHVLRRMSAVVQATPAELTLAERDATKLQALEDAAAMRSYIEGAGDLLAFFTRLGLSVNASRDSSGEAGETEGKKDTIQEPETPADSPSGSS